MPEIEKSPIKSSTSIRPHPACLIKLKCPICMETPLLEEKSWFSFRKGCPNCRYLYEREEGYFWGAAWMMNYPIVGATMLITGAVLFLNNPEISSNLLASGAAIAGVLGGIAFWPFGRAAWMLLDHFWHPINANDHKNYKDSFNHESDTTTP